MLFRDECDRAKDATHLNSFMYDHHLSVLNEYISDNQTQLLRHGYHAVSLLHDLPAFFPMLPLFTRHVAQSGISNVLVMTHVHC